MTARMARWFGVTSTALLLTACPKKPSPHDAGTDAIAPVASVVPEAGPTVTAAANQAEVTHYPDQNADKLETVKARWTTPARTEASRTEGKLVIEVKAGTEAQRLADHEGFDLIVVTDPADASRKLEGWAMASAFETTPEPGTVRRP